MEKKKLIILLLILIITKFSLQCKKGCLKCDIKTKKCILCDFAKNYILENNECFKKKNNKNCEFIDIFGNCLKCQKNYFIDFLTKKCLKIEKKIENCEIYENMITCKFCKKNFYLKNGKCILNFKIVENCKFLQNEESCRICEENFIFNFFLQKCEKIPFLSNCVGFTYLKCEKCSDDFFYDENFYFKKYYGFEKFDNFSKISQIVYNDFYKKKENITKFICHKKKDLNCLEFENFEICKICKKNYFLNFEKKCEKFPEKEIEFCEDYLDEENCKNCKNGFFLKNKKFCEKNYKINNCEKYDGSIKSTICLKCEKNFFLEFQICKKREISLKILNCLDYDEKNDFCKKCSFEYILTNDFLKCLKKIKNCQNYFLEKTNEFSEKIFCKKCQKKFFLKNNFCEEGKIQNCEEFENNGEICKKCQKKFFLKNNFCEKNLLIENCEENNSLKQNFCEICDKNFFLTKLKNFCYFSEKIKNCEFYKTKIICEKCKIGFFLENSKCEKIPENLKCDIFENKKCVKCKQNYFFVNNKCLYIYNSIFENCGKFEKNNFSSENLFFKNCNFVKKILFL